MVFLHNVQHLYSLDCNYDRFLSGTGIFHSETRYRTAVPEQCSGQVLEHSLNVSNQVAGHSHTPVSDSRCQ
jgi:hypothetical protein